MHIGHRTISRFVVALGCLALATCTLRGASQAEVDRIADLLRLETGQVLADVGAGDGDFAEGLAAKVGSEGLVFATEVKQELVDEIKQRMRDAAIHQVKVVLGGQDSIGLSAGCCDAILLGKSP